MPYRTWITMTFPTHVIFRYHLPLMKWNVNLYRCEILKQPFLSFSASDPPGEATASSTKVGISIFFQSSNRILV